MSVPKPPAILDAIVDKVLAYRPKKATEAGKKRKRKANKVAKKLRKDAADMPQEH